MIKTFGVGILIAGLIFASESDTVLSTIAVGLTGALLIIMILNSWPRMAPLLFKKGG